MHSTSGRMTDPLAGSPWSARETVAVLARAPANRMLVRFASEALGEVNSGRAVDIGCGAARNASALAGLGWRVVGTDLSWPMLCAARDRLRVEHVDSHVLIALASMERLPIASHTCDLVVADGIWNLACSAAHFRAALDEAARVAKAGAALFVFTFLATHSRKTRRRCQESSLSSRSSPANRSAS
jgi:ubiquinone/menaquinone biosynthesis C-methylase UbiE